MCTRMLLPARWPLTKDYRVRDGTVVQQLKRVMREIKEPMIPGRYSNRERSQAEYGVGVGVWGGDMGRKRERKPG